MTDSQLHIVHTEASQGWGGQEIRILTEAKGMMERGHKITLLTPKKAQIYDAAKSLGIETVAMPYEKRSWKAVFATRKWLKENNPDVVNTHSSIDSWVTGLARIRLKNSPAIVRTRHISAPIRQDFTSRWLYGKAADHVVTTGETLRLSIIERLGLPKNHVTSIPTGIDLNKFNQKNTKDKTQIRQELNIPENVVVIGIAATLRSWKGHNDLLEAFELIAEEHPNTHLLIAGDGPQKDSLKSWISNSKLNSRIHLIGHRSDVPDVLAAMNIFALPSYANEGVPQAILQAMAMELPVVSTNVGAIEEAVLHQKTGIVTEAQSAIKLAHSINMLISDIETREAFAAASLKHIQNNFSIDQMLNQMTRAFQSAYQKHSETDQVDRVSK